MPWVVTSSYVARSGSDNDLNVVETGGGPERDRRFFLTPMLYPMKIDLARGRVLQVEMDQGAFRSASFLDDRMLTPATRGGWVPLQELLSSAAAQSGACPLHFIFHTGHVGSTLVSRLLDETGHVLSLREPLPLRTLAAAQDALRDGTTPPLTQEQLDALVTMCLHLWRRGFAMTEAVVVKATSSCARLAPSLLGAAPEARAIYLNLRAEAWLATLLAGENSPIDLRGHAPERLRRLSMYLQSPLPPLEALSLGELAALGWLTETSTQLALLADWTDRVLAIDFDVFLSDVTGQLQRILAHFNLPQDAAFLAQVRRSPVLTRYSKAPEHPYDPALRAAVLHDSRRRHREEIAKGMRMLEGLVRNEPKLGALFSLGRRPHP